MNNDEKLQIAIQHHQTGNVKQAEYMYRDILKTEPDNPYVLYLIGIAYLEIGLYDVAVEHLNKSLQLNPNNPEAYYNLGTILQDMKQFDEAAKCYQNSIQLNPGLVDAYYNLGTIFQELGQLDKAVTYYQKSLQLDPDSYDILNILGVIYQQKGQFDEAICCYQEAVHINPNFSEAFNNLGNILQEKELFDEAICCYQKAVQINPSFSEAFNNLGNALQKNWHLDEAIASYHKALQLKPDNSEALNNLGTAFKEKGQFDKSLQYLQKALKINPSHIDAHWNMSLTLLSSGDYNQGWRDYEWRFLKKDARPSVFPQPRWDGRQLEGKSIIVTAEQGVGDEIMFASCLPEMIAKADLCIVECDKRLIPIFARSFPKTILIERLDSVDSYRTDITSAEMQIPVGSLPKFFRPDLASFPQQGEYLIPDNYKTEIWQKRYTELGPGIKIGISWKGGSKPAEKLARSTVLAQWAKLFSVLGAHFINLQYGDCTSELREVREKLDITIHDWEDADPLKDLDDLAAQIAALDLVISVDNATVHMAGALGVPVWVLLPFACDWRWMREYEDTPWYKSVRLIRQKNIGDWEGIFERITSNLKQYISTRTIPEIKYSYKSSS